MGSELTTVTEEQDLEFTMGSFVKIFSSLLTRNQKRKQKLGIASKNIIKLFYT